MATTAGSGASGGSSASASTGTAGASANPSGATSAGSADRNSVAQSRPRQRKPAADKASQSELVHTEGTRSTRPAKVVNSISLPRVRGATVGEVFEEGPKKRQEHEAAAKKRAPGQQASTGSEKPADSVEREDLSSVPEHVRQRFVQVGRKYYFPDGARAFTDRGRRLTTPSENTEVIRSLVTIAQSRGWNEIVVRGTDQFRREAWFAARMVGLEVRGYRPSEVEQARLVRTLASRQQNDQKPAAEAKRPPEKGKAASGKRSGPSEPELLTGRLLEHGPAPFQEDPHEAMSYFAKIQTPKGERVVWGVDLERAFAESQTRPKIGDEIGLRSVRKDPVTVKAAKRDDKGKVVGEKDLDTHRNRWIVEKAEFFQRREAAAKVVRDTRVDPKEAVKSHPELVGTYLQIRAAELAAKNFKDPKDRERFVSTVRSKLAESVARGEPPVRVKMRERTASRPPVQARAGRAAEQAPVRG